MQKPNLILIQTDSHDGRLLGCLDHPSLLNSTPNLDRFASQGVLLEQAYCNFPLCCPSRASLWSGRHPHKLAAWNNSRGILPETPTFMTQFAASGYRTRAFGRTDHISGAHSLHARVSSWTRAAAIPRPLHSIPKIRPAEGGLPHAGDALAIQQGCDWLHEAAGDARPFLLYIGLHMPHHPFSPTPQTLDGIPLSTVGMPPQDKLDHPLLPLQRLQKGSCGASNPDEILQLRQAYFATVAETDLLFGQVLQALEAEGLQNRTYVIFCSDHGEMAGEHGQYLKQTLFESSVRVPLIIRGPDIPSDQRISKPVSLLDLHPTLFDLAGLSTPEDAEGCTFAPELYGTSGTHPGQVLSQYHASACPASAFMLRQNEWKYMVFPGFAPLLFNLREDPDELQDCSAQEPATAEQLDARLQKLVNTESIDARAREDDKACFQAWREIAMREGTYHLLMADIYGRANGSFPHPWRSEDEDRIEAWLSGCPLPLPSIDTPGM